MFKRIPPARQRRLLQEAARSPLSEATVSYPHWYLQRWHFLPAGYFSRGSIAGYEHLIRRIYYSGGEHHVLRRLQAAVPASARTVLDLGCGPGRALAAIAAARPHARVAGVDLSPFMLERAARRLQPFGHRAHLRHADVTAAPLPEEPVDTVIAMHLFGHLPPDASAAAAGQAARALAPGGRLIAVDHRWHPRPSLPLPEVHAESLLGGLMIMRVFTNPLPA